ncbi:rIIB-like protein [Rhodococcus phage Weasels2]|uniref:RIIB-like protein n=1 Tax=Rhodococcus phage Weasels2 TaxID=1897437 RepID=A0A1I9SAA3_9CAUD|nr:RIIB lysis inhibitor [Rhodococcus phage Weasels2]AOZ63709.1 rIIB-like protein [Rhodococcus phage Weasels2]
MAQFNYVSKEGTEVVTALINGKLLTITNDHPNFESALNRLRKVEDGDVEEFDEIEMLFDPVKKIEKVFAKISTRVSIEDGQVLYEGDPIHSTLADEILRFHNDGDDGYEPLAKFLEKVYQNPNPHSREMLFDWISEADLTINRDGDIVGYRGLNSDFTSKHSGGAIVNGEKVNGHIPNNPGNVIEMARGEVTFDPQSECAYGLHIGTYDYASWWGQIIVECVIDPTDVVSVPEYDHRKMRVCRYRVVDVVDSKYTDSYLDTGFDPDEDFDEIADDDDYWDNHDAPEEAVEDTDKPEPGLEWLQQILQKINVPKQNYITNNFVAPAVTNNVVDTTKNHLKQQRDANGRFIKKGN